MRRLVLVALVALALVGGVSAFALPVFSADPQSASANQPSPTTYGVRVDLFTGDPRKILNGIDAMNLQWVSLDVSWASIETAQGVYDWAGLDAAIELAYDANKWVLVRVADAPDWAREDGANLEEQGPPADPETFATFLKTMADRYDRKITAYEVWPGANTVAAWNSPGGLSPAAYVALLEAAYPVIRHTSPSAVIVSGALVPVPDPDGTTAMDDLDYLQAMYDAGVADTIDALGVAVNGHDNAPAVYLDGEHEATGDYSDKSVYFFRHYEAVRDVMLGNDDSDNPVWLTSVGWASSDTPLPDAAYADAVSEDEQAEYLVEAFAMAGAEPFIDVLVVDNFNLVLRPDANPLDRARSLLREDWSARPAFLALAQVQQDAAAATEIRGPTPNVPQGIRVLLNWSPRLPEWAD